MATRVFTGWRVVTPGACSVCGYDSDWGCTGRGVVICSCQCDEDGDAPNGDSVDFSEAEVQDEIR